MSITKTLSICLLITSTILFSCKKDDKASSPTPTPKDTLEYFTCKLNGVNYIDDARFADYIAGTTRVISQNNDELIRLNIGGMATGTYTITSGNATNTIIYVDGNGIQYDAISGSIVVTEYNTTDQIISGSFSGVLKKSTDNTQITVTEGKFNYIELLPF